MSYRLGGTDPFWRASIGAFNGYVMNTPLSCAYLLKRAGTGSWMGVHVVDDGAANSRFFLEFNPSNQLAADTGTAGWASAAALASTTEWMILAYEWDGSNTAGNWIWRWKVGAAAWQSEAETATNRAGAFGAGYRHIIGNEAGLGDDANFDICCGGAIKADLGQAPIESLTMTDFASWQAVFAGANAALWGFETIAAQVDRTGNGANELSRSAGVTLQADPAGWSWGGASKSLLVSSRRNRGLVLRR